MLNNAISVNIEFGDKRTFLRMKVAIYCRVSTGEQNPKHQEESLRKFAKNKGYDVVKVFTDVITGSKASRPELNELMKYIYAKEIDAVLVWKLDRLGRSLQHLIKIVNDMNNYGVGLICETQQIDTTNSTGKLIFHIFGAIAEFERNLISERTKLGLKNAKNVGKRGKDKKVRRKSGYLLRYAQKKGGGQIQ